MLPRDRFRFLQQRHGHLQIPQSDQDARQLTQNFREVFDISLAAGPEQLGRALQMWPSLSVFAHVPQDHSKEEVRHRNSYPCHARLLNRSLPSRQRFFVKLTGSPVVAQFPVGASKVSESASSLPEISLLHDRQGFLHEIPGALGLVELK
jgi:hypothetical protein